MWKFDMNTRRMPGLPNPNTNYPTGRKAYPAPPGAPRRTNAANYCRKKNETRRSAPPWTSSGHSTRNSRRNLKNLVEPLGPDPIDYPCERDWAEGFCAWLAQFERRIAMAIRSNAPNLNDLLDGRTVRYRLDGQDIFDADCLYRPFRCSRTLARSMIGAARLKLTDSAQQPFANRGRPRRIDRIQHHLRY